MASPARRKKKPPRRKPARAKPAASKRIAVKPAAAKVRKSAPAKLPGAAAPALLQAAGLKKLSWLRHGFSTRGGKAGSFDLGRSAASPATVSARRARFVLATGAVSRGKPWPLVTLRQVHSDIIHSVHAPPAGSDAADALPAGDGLLTRLPGLLLAVQTADCLPVLLADPEQRAVGIFHAGWRGTLARIVEKGVGRMRAEFGSRPQRLRAALGPSIRACCYQVGPEVRELFRSQFAYADDLFREVFDLDPVREKYPLLFMTARAPGHGEPASSLRLDLIAANRRQLLDAGLDDNNIEVSGLCTACRTDLLFSYRKEKDHAGRMFAAIGLTG